jgi:hypothetical protein
MGSRITLTAKEREIARVEGAARHRRRTQGGSRMVFGRASASIHEGGVWGELAVARALGLPPEVVCGDRPDKEGDLGVPGLQVRHTALEYGRLPLHPTTRTDGRAGDADDHLFTLVRGLPADLELAGWCLGREGKIERWWRTDIPYPCYLVPTSELRPVDREWRELLEARLPRFPAS